MPNNEIKKLVDDSLEDLKYALQDSNKELLVELLNFLPEIPAHGWSYSSACAIIIEEVPELAEYPYVMNALAGLGHLLSGMHAIIRSTYYTDSGLSGIEHHNEVVQFTISRIREEVLALQGRGDESSPEVGQGTDNGNEHDIEFTMDAPSSLQLQFCSNPEELVNDFNNLVLFPESCHSNIM